MRQEIDKIEIKEPPIEELNKKRSCMKRTCLNGCGCFVFLFIISLVLLRFTVGPRTKEVRDLPAQLTEAIPIYDRDAITSITYTPGTERGKRAEMAAYIPKLIISPLVIYFDNADKYIPVPETPKDATKWQRFVAFMGQPITDHRDIYTIEWNDLTADKKFLLEYYESELKKQNFEIGLRSTNDNITQFIFTKKDIDGVVYIMDDPTTPNTDLISLTANIMVSE